MVNSKHRQERSVAMYAQYTFENFISGPSNLGALTAAQAMTSTPAAALPPVYLHGPVASGKTHLLCAIKNRIERLSPDRRVICKKFDDFTEELIQSFRNRRIQEFRSTYCSADVLLVDDVQYIQGKEATQEEFLLILRSLLDRGGMVMLTSSCPLEALSVLKKSALFSEVALLPPDIGHKLTVAAFKAAEYGLSLPEAVLEYLAKHGDNIRQIEGGLKRILICRELGTPELTQQSLLKMLSEEWLPLIRKPPVIR